MPICNLKTTFEAPYADLQPQFVVPRVVRALVHVMRLRLGTNLLVLRLWLSTNYQLTVAYRI